MKKVTVFLFFLVFLVTVPRAYAHPPSDIKITFDPATRILQAVIIHNTSNLVNHYINKVDVGLNGKEIVEHEIRPATFGAALLIKIGHLHGERFPGRRGCGR